MAPRNGRDQVAEGGNKALLTSMSLGIPVRLVRKAKDKSSPSGTLFTYECVPPPCGSPSTVPAVEPRALRHAV